MKTKIRYWVLAKSVPEKSKKYGGTYTCTLGLAMFNDGSTDLIRVYPATTNSFKKHCIYELNVIKNPLDTRLESWKIADFSLKEGLITAKNIIYKGTNKPENLKIDRWLYSSISEMNELKVSIGFIQTKYNLQWQPNDIFEDENQLTLFDSTGFNVEKCKDFYLLKDSKPYQLRLIFKDIMSKHNIQFNEWHMYVGLDKYGVFDLKNYIGKNTILLGNMIAHRSNWIGFGLYNYRIKNQLQIFN